MKIIVEVYATAERLAELCHRGEDRCPLSLRSPIACPFADKLCDDITPEDWKKLEVKDE